MLKWITRRITRDTPLKSAQYAGMPAPTGNWRSIYNRKNLIETLRMIENKCRGIERNRIIVLYVPSYDARNLRLALELVCYLMPLHPEGTDDSGGFTSIEWRDDRTIVENTVYQALQIAWNSTNALKAEITDKRISALTLPARNFYFPDRDSTISDVYSTFAQQSYDVPRLKDSLLPSRFTRDQLHGKAFKGNQYTDQFFQDMRGRVFPPDLYHGKNRDQQNETISTTLSEALRQKFRFGVTVRDGNLHYDVQYQLPRRLMNEPMHCAATGDVWVTGSHANVGVNDVIWVPDGKKEPRLVDKK